MNNSNTDWRLYFILDILILYLVLVIAKSSGSDDCPPIPNDCNPDCIVYDVPHCRKCDCTRGGNYGMTFGNGGDGQSSGSGGSPFNQGMELSKTPFSSSIDAMGTSLGGGGMGEVSGVGMGGMRNGLMSVPGMFLHGPSKSRGHVACLRDDIICPTYCLVIDEFGCKSCPCGPASGMGVSMISHGHSNKGKQQQSNNQCIATLVCMLSCDDGYKLGPKGQDGCQTCECTKHKNKDETGKQKDTNKDANKSGGQGNGTGSGQGGSTGSKTGQGGSTGSKPSQGGSIGTTTGQGSGSGFNPMFPGSSVGSGSGMGTGSMGGGSFSSGCTGPFCTQSTTGGNSIKGPFQMFGQDKHNGGGGGTTSSGDRCIGPSCSAPGKASVIAQSCPTTDLCVTTCKYTVKLGAKMADGCPSCACEKSVVETVEAPKQKLCDDVVKCMISCTEGYKLKSGNVGDCPVCVCAQPPTQAPTSSSMTNVHSCTEQAIRCMQTCKNGYHMTNSRNRDCPVCSCLPPPTVAPTKPGIYSVLKHCPDTVHCMTTCRNGYILDGGSTGCPRCSCNQVGFATLNCKSALSCAKGCQLGYKCGAEGCPTCACVEAKEIGVAHTVTYIQASLTCSADFSCVRTCQFGYKTGDNGCPTCRCLQQLTVTHHLTMKDRCPQSDRCSELCPHGYSLRTQIEEECPVCECKRLVTENAVAILHPSKMTYEQFAKLCPQTTKCIQSCIHGYTTTTGTGSCPVCHCREPATEAPKVLFLKQAISGIACTGLNCPENNKETHSIQDRCPDTFKCNDICDHGFSLRSVVGRECPVCECAKLVSEIIPVKSGSVGVMSQGQQIGSGSVVLLSQGQQNGSRSVVVLSQGQQKASGSVGVMSQGQHKGSGSMGVMSQVQHKGSGSVGVMSQGQQKGSGNMSVLPGHTGSVSVQGSSHHSVSGHATITGNNVGGENCFGPACSAKNGFHSGMKQNKQLQPNQCADILTCVVSCKHGYKLGPKGLDGCPTCQCLE